MPAESWIDVGASEELSQGPVQQVVLGSARIALSYRDGQFGAISGVCNHVGGPLGEGTLYGEYVVCPRHYWKCHDRTGQREPGYEEDRVPACDMRVENGRVFVRSVPGSHDPGAGAAFDPSRSSTIRTLNGRR